MIVIRDLKDLGLIKVGSKIKFGTRDTRDRILCFDGESYMDVSDSSGGNIEQAHLDECGGLIVYSSHEI